MRNPMAFVSKVDNTMYLHQPDKAEFIKAMSRRSWQMKEKRLEASPLSDVLKGTQVLDSIWAIRRRWWICTTEIYEARLNAHGRQQIHGVTHWEMSAPCEPKGRRQYSRMVSKMYGDPKINTVRATRVKLHDNLAIKLDYCKTKWENYSKLHLLGRYIQNWL